MRETRGEVTRTCTNVGYDGIRRQRQRLYYFVRFLPRIALRIVENLRPLLRILEVVLMRVRRLRCGGACE